MIDLRIPEHLESSRKWQTENPLGEVWRQLLLASDYTYLKSNWSASDDDLVSVTTYLRQAHEYHLASRAVTLMTSPLLIYYSALNLAKAVINVVNDCRSSDYHGLCKPKMEDSLLDVSVETNNGVFLELARLAGTTICVGRRLRLEDFLQNMLDVQKYYCEYFERPTQYVWPSVEAFLSGRVEVVFTTDLLRGKSVEDFRALLHERTNLYDDFEEVESEDALKLESRENYEGEERRIAMLDLIQRHFEFSVFPQYHYFINLLSEEDRIPPVAAYFGAMYVLSEIVRYKPNHIHRFLRERETSVEWFIQQLCSVSERVLPNLFFNILTDGRHKFIS